MSQAHWNICVAGKAPACDFAAAEFVRLMALVDPAATTVIGDNSAVPDQPVLRIGCDAALLRETGSISPDEVDDAINIKVMGGAGFITGSNPVSVLIGVYRFFRELGCVFVRPGRDGEYIVQHKSEDITVAINERAAYRHRGICLEGAVSYENVAEMVDFAPKLGFNAYFTQLLRPSFAFKRWYGHQNNPLLLPTQITDETLDAMVRNYDQEILRRGLSHHRMGHGWISKVLGIISSAWHEKNDDSEVIPERRELIALMDGKRMLFNGSGIDTNLCYSDPRAAEMLADEISDYAAANPAVRYLHFWLADHANNQCECEKCRDQRPADLYVEILNRIDEKLTARQLSVKIVFLIYLDLLWEPVRAKLKNPERFVLTYAPIRRSYSIPMADDSGREAAPFVRNGFEPQAEPGATLPYLKAWQRVFGGDSFVFDYHYMWDYLNDPGSIQCARIMEQDVENLHKLGLNGMMSCQNQRVFMPNALGMNLMGEAMWSGKSDFKKRSEKYFFAAYGPDGGKCLNYLEAVSAAVDPVILRGEKPVNAPGAATGYTALLTVIDEFQKVIKDNLDRAVLPLQRRSWEILAFHSALCRKITQLLLCFAAENSREAESMWQELSRFARENEMAFQREFDLFEFILVWENKILPRLRSAVEGDVE